MEFHNILWILQYFLSIVMMMIRHADFFSHIELLFFFPNFYRFSFCGSMSRGRPRHDPSIHGGEGKREEGGVGVAQPRLLQSQPHGDGGPGGRGGRHRRSHAQPSPARAGRFRRGRRWGRRRLQRLRRWKDG